MRTVLHDADGPVGTYDRDERGGVVYADLFRREPGVSAERAARAALADLRGMRIAGDEALGHALIAAGGRALRHAHLMSHDLAERPDWHEPPGYRLSDVDRPAADLVDAFRAAYPPGHVDRREESDEQVLNLLDGYVEGREFGPLLRGSGLAATPDGAVVGGILIGTLPGDPPLNGPWIIEVFRDPEHPGVGRALLERALAIADAPALGLMVTEGNPARGLYEALGFRVVRTVLVVQI
jgi:ribosomal protein S18 acetylase RimI-like enzyme